MSEPLKAAVFACREHGANLLAYRGVMKDPRVGHSEVLISCCSKEGLDQIQLHLMGRTTDAMLVLGCEHGNLPRYQGMAMAAGIPATRVAVVSASMRAGVAAELALARILDPREAVHAPARVSEAVLLIGSGPSADAFLEQAAEEGLTVISVEPEDLMEEHRLLGGPGNFSLEVGETLYEFGAAVLAMDDAISVERDLFCDRPGTLVALVGGEECLETFVSELEKSIGTGPTYALAQETPFIGMNELLYRGLQENGVIFLRSSEVQVSADGALVRDEHLGHDVLVPVGAMVTVRSSRPDLADPLLSMFALPSGHRSTGPRTGESGAPGVWLCGSTFTSSFGEGTVDTARACAVKLAEDLRSPVTTTPLAKVDVEKCSLCLTCLRLCPYGAPFVEGGKMSISTLRCQGCGMCVAMCPSYAIDMPPSDLRGEVGAAHVGEVMR